MYSQKSLILLAVAIFAGALACSPGDIFGDVFVALATATPTATRTPRPTFTSLPTLTNTPLPTRTATLAPTATATKKPPTPKPPTRKPPTVKPPATVAPQPVVSQYEFHVNPPSCGHSGITFLKGTVYLDKNDPSQRYAGAIVALGPPDGSTIYDKVKTDGMGEYTFVVSNPGEPGRV